MKYGARSTKYGAAALLLMMTLTPVLSSCSPSSNLDEPPHLSVGRDICERCGMIIEDLRFASGYRLEDGTSKTFDDIGGMLAWAKLSGDLDARLWVHDYHSEEWIEASTATFVFSSEIMSPMAFGISAFSDPTAAASFAEEVSGMVHTWDEVLEDTEAGKIEDHHGGDAAETGDDSTHVHESEQGDS